jgi:putative phosphoribosyl transferase
LFRPHIAPLFENRYDAGRQLASRLTEYQGEPVLVLAIPNGGLPIASEIAKALNAELDVVVVRKLPIPLHPEAGFGAVADDGSVILNEELVKREGLTKNQVNEQIAVVTSQVRQRSLLYRKDRTLSSVRGKTAIVVDDGLASGYTMLAAVESVRRRRPRDTVVAVPAASSIALKVMGTTAKVVTIAEGKEPTFAVADYYRHWYDVHDNEALKILEERRTPPTFSHRTR